MQLVNIASIELDMFALGDSKSPVDPNLLKGRSFSKWSQMIVR